MQEIFGHFVEPDDAGSEYLKIHFSPASAPLEQRWRNNGVSANFLADYWTPFFPAHDESSRQRQTRVKESIAYIANELLENQMKYNDPAAEYPVELALYLRNDTFTFYAANAIARSAAASFRSRIQSLLTKAPFELYVQQVQTNMTAGHPSGSGLGFLTMLHDYEAKLAWKFAPLPQHTCIIVTTMVELSV